MTVQTGYGLSDLYAKDRPTNIRRLKVYRDLIDLRINYAHIQSLTRWHSDILVYRPTHIKFIEI